MSVEVKGSPLDTLRAARPGEPSLTCCVVARSRAWAHLQPASELADAYHGGVGAGPITSSSYLDQVARESRGRARFVLLVLLTMVTFSFVGGLVVLPVTAILPSGEVGALITNLLPFVGSLALVWVLVRVLMRRPLWTFAAPAPRAEWGLFGRAVAIQLGCLAVGTTVFSLSPVGSLDVSSPDFSQLAILAPIALVGFAIQTGVEEVVFRGIWPQAVLRFTSRVVVAYTVAALAFASVHIGNVGALGGGWVALVPYFATASLWGWVSYRTGSLWASWGLHFANNVYLVLLIGSHDDVVAFIPPVAGG